MTAKIAREAFQTLPGVRVFFIDALRHRAPNGSPCGINEVIQEAVAEQRSSPPSSVKAK